MVKDSEFQKVWAGQAIRFPVEEKGRYVPASVEKWIDEFSISVPFDDCGVKHIQGKTLKPEVVKAVQENFRSGATQIKIMG